jgi:hypothetical protein
MAYDDVILRMGEFGRYQRRVYLLLCLPAISCAFHKLAGVFLGARMDSRYDFNELKENTKTYNREKVASVCKNFRYSILRTQFKREVTRIKLYYSNILKAIILKNYEYIIIQKYNDLLLHNYTMDPDEVK